MITHVNVGPARSGTTTLHKIFKEHPQVYPTKVKEAYHNTFNHNDISTINTYLDSCNYQNLAEEKSVILDATPALATRLESRDKLKSIFSKYFDQFRHIVLLRDPISYYRTLFYNAYIEHITLQSLGYLPYNDDYHLRFLIDFKIDENIITEFIEQNISNVVTQLKHVKMVLEIYEPNEVLLIELNYLKDSIRTITDFLGIEYYPLDVGNHGTFEKKVIWNIRNYDKTGHDKLRNIVTHHLIKKILQKNKMIQDLIIYEAQEIEKLRQLLHPLSNKNLVKNQFSAA